MIPTQRNADVKRFLDHAATRFEWRFGEKLPVDGGKDGALIKRMLGTYSYDKLCRWWEEFLNLDTPFLREAGYSIGIFKSQLPRLVTSAARAPSVPTGFAALQALQARITPHDDTRSGSSGPVSPLALPFRGRETD